MGKRLGILGAGIAVVALVVGAVSPALGSSSQGSASTSSGQTIRVIFVPTEFAEIDAGAAGFSLGDEVVFAGDLTRRDGTPVGRYGVVCTFVSTANADRVEAQCPATATLPGGQITVQGMVVNRSVNVTLPITGGSGQFQGAGGQLVQRDVSTPTQPQVELTFHLEF
jgi:hypothetical protein